MGFSCKAGSATQATKPGVPDLASPTRRPRLGVPDSASPSFPRRRESSARKRFRQRDSDERG
ncbi:hypothetical protein AAKU58_000790 [Oxalobacteraceae bacterium GrIS 1.18]